MPSKRGIPEIMYVIFMLIWPIPFCIKSVPYAIYSTIGSLCLCGLLGPWVSRSNLGSTARVGACESVCKARARSRYDTIGVSRV